MFRTSSYGTTLERHEDWIITDHQRLEDTKLIMHGSIIITGDGRLDVKDSMLYFKQEYNNQYRIQVGEWGDTGSPEYHLENVFMDANWKWMYASFTGNAVVSLDGMRARDSNIPWHSAGSNVEVTMKDTIIGLTLADNTTLVAEDCNLFLEFVLRNCSGSYTLPLGEVDELDFTYEMGRETIQVETTNCEFREWGVTLDYLTDITYVDTKITVGMNAGSGPDGLGEKVVIEGLKAEKYDDLEVDYDTNHLRMVNSEAVSWYPQAFNGATVEAIDCYLADVQWNGSNSTVIVRDSTAYIAYAMQNVTYIFYDSTINGEVTATEDSKVYLIITKVTGKITETGNGQVFIDEEPPLVTVSNEEDPPLAYQNVRVITGDWIITDHQEITNTMVTLDGSVFIKGDGKLVVRDSYFNVTMDYNNEHKIEVGEYLSTDTPSLEMYNVMIDTSGVWMPVRFFGSSKIVYDNVNPVYSNMPWHGAESSVMLNIIDSEIGVTIGENATLQATDSLLFLEIMFSEPNGTYSLPIGEIPEYDLKIRNGKDMVSIEIEGCTFYEWGTTLDHHTNITFVDTVMTIGMNAGLGTPAPEDPIVLTDLKAKKYDYMERDYDTNHLTLINTDVVEWYPQVFGGTVLEISNSKLADLQWNGGDSVVTLRNCTLQIATAMQEVNYFIHDSVIDGDVTATEDSKIYLYSTTVGGRIIELDNGQVFIDNEPYEG